MNMVGESSNRIHRQGNSRPTSETRWIVPVRPYTPPKHSMERVENAILMGAGAAVVIFAFMAMIAAEMM